jgi:transcriptional regulator with XRE-family HTH domain
MSGHTPWAEIKKVRQTNEHLLRGHHVAASAATWLIALREGAGLSEAQLAERMGVSTDWVRETESNPDVRVASVATYVAAVGGELQFRCLLPGIMPFDLTEMPAEVPAPGRIAKAV